LTEKLFNKGCSSIASSKTKFISMHIAYLPFRNTLDGQGQNT
jgi:hypothetical protein